jgi:hypothetical protein
MKAIIETSAYLNETSEKNNYNFMYRQILRVMIKLGLYIREQRHRIGGGAVLIVMNIANMNSLKIFHC